MAEGLDDTFRQYGRKLRHLPGYDLAERMYPRIANATQCLLMDRSLTLNGFYTIDPEGVDINPFDLWITNGSYHNRLKVKGRYEQPVMEALAKRVTEDTVFWEVGAAIGYFSIAMAGLAQKVVAFDTKEPSLQKLEESSERNNYDNVTAVRGKVGGEVDLKEYELPDVVLMDIEGWELTTLQSSTSLLKEQPVWIIEIHEPRSHNDYRDENNPDKIQQLFQNYGYQTQRIYQRRPENYHLLAEPLE